MSQLLSPSAIVDYVEHAASDKAGLDFPRFLVLAVLGGIFISLGGLLSVVVVGGSPDLVAHNVGLAKFLFGALFPMGLIAVVLTGADLFTSNCAVQAAGCVRGSVTVGQLLRVWGISYAGNFVGALFTVWAFAYMTHLLTPEQPWTGYLVKLAEHKLENPFLTTFFKGVLANLLVCVASWQAYASKDSIGRIVGIWFPVMAFVTLGMEHSIANMFFIPAAMVAGLDASWLTFVTANLFPATLGNIAGGALFVGVAYAWSYSAPGRMTQSHEHPESATNKTRDLAKKQG